MWPKGVSFKESVLENLESFELVSGAVCFTNPIILDVSAMKSSEFEISKESTVILQRKKNI